MTLPDPLPDFDPIFPTPAQQQREEALDVFASLGACPELRVLAISTTSLKGVPVAVSVLDRQGRVLLDTLVYTTQPIDPEAQAVHHVSERHLADAPSFASVTRQLREVLGVKGARVVSFAPSFTRAALDRGEVEAATRHGLNTRDWIDAGELTARVSGYWDPMRERFSRVSLKDALRETAAEHANMVPAGTSLGNAQRLLGLIRWHADAPRLGPPAEDADETTCPDCGAPGAFCECRVHVDPDDRFHN